MIFTLSAHRRATTEGKSFYRLRFLSILWAIFMVSLISFVTPVPKTAEGYEPVYARASVKGAATKQEIEIVGAEGPAFFSQEIIAEKFVPTPTPTKAPVAAKSYGKARQIGEYTWTIDVADDDHAGSAQEVFQALNAYRQKNGKGSLSWSGALTAYAQSRSDLFASQGKTDSHAGFKDYLDNQDGFTKLGFMKIGENSSFGYKVTGARLIEEVYGGDKPHDDNQLSGDWTQVGIGVNGLATDIIFAGNPL